MVTCNIAHSTININYQTFVLSIVSVQTLIDFVDYLNSGLSEAYPHCHLLSHEDVGVVGL